MDNALIDPLAAAYENDIGLAQRALRRGDPAQAFHHLERAHIVGQRHTLRHTYSHWLMLRAGLQSRDAREVLGQLPRMVASLLFSRLWVPRGNSGRARVPALKPMPIPADLRNLGL